MRVCVVFRWQAKTHGRRRAYKAPRVTNDDLNENQDSIIGISCTLGYVEPDNVGHWEMLPPVKLPPYWSGPSHKRLLGEFMIIGKLMGARR